MSLKILAIFCFSISTSHAVHLPCPPGNSLKTLKKLVPMTEKDRLQALALSRTPFSDIQKVDFPKPLYEKVTQQMREQVNAWINAAKTPEQSAILKSHLIHLQGLERDLLSYRSELEAAGVSVERLQAQIWVHDIGKFIPADPLIAQRYAAHPAKGFAEFLEHSKTSQQYLRAHPFFSNGKDGIDNLTRQLYYDIAGHDGPAVPGSWWGENYGAITGRVYPEAQSPYLNVLDRLDQPALLRAGNVLNGGPRKISLQVSAKITNQRAIWEGLESVPEGTFAQYQKLVETLHPQPNTVMDQMLSKLKSRIEEVRLLRKNTYFYQSAETSQMRGILPENIVRKTNHDASIGYVLVNGKKIPFSDLNSFYGTSEHMGAAAAWDAARTR